jgi:hypothetical protein
MQLPEYFFVFNGVKADSEANVRPAPVLLQELLSRLREIEEKDDEVDV